MLVRGFYYDGWHPAGKPRVERHKDDFLAHIAAQFPEDRPSTAERVTRAVFAVLGKHLTAGEVEKIKHTLPAEVRALWEAKLCTL
jgi:uncharacterized protein (DUF2267 family)